MSQNISDGLIELCSEIIDGLRQRHHEIVDDHVFEERIRGIENTSLALYEAKDFLQETKRFLSINN